MPIPHDFDTSEIETILTESHPEDIGMRVAEIGKRFLGRPYRDEPLVGSSRDKELFTFSFLEFDCVTFVETVAAISRSASSEEFLDELRKIRYKDGLVDWPSRNHYFSEWIANNIESKVVTEVSIPGRQVIRKTLSTLPNYPELKREVAISTPRQEAWSALVSGDIVAFASERPNLDYFHVGILLKEPGEPHLLHAAKSRGCVLREPITEFIKANNCLGISAVRVLPKQ